MPTYDRKHSVPVTNKKHIARSGSKAGQWVNCTATQNCTLGGLHIKEQQFFSVAIWLEETGNKKLMKDITHADVQSYLKLTDADSQEWKEKARLRALKTKGIKNAPDDFDPFINDTKSFEAGLKSARESLDEYHRRKVSYRSITDEEKEINLNDKLGFFSETEWKRLNQLAVDNYWDEGKYRELKDAADDYRYKMENDIKVREYEKMRKEQAAARIEQEKRWKEEDARAKAELAELGSNKVIKYNNEIVVSAETFESLKLEVIENGGDLTFSGADILEYSDSRPSEIRIRNLRATGKMEFLTDLGKKIEKETSFSSSIRAISFEMKKKDYEKFLSNYSDKNKDIIIYPQREKIIQKSFGREIVVGSFDVKGHGRGINTLVEDLKDKKQFHGLSRGDALRPTTATYQEPVADEDSRKHLNKLYRNLKVANEGSNSMLNHEEQHFLERAKSSYLPTIINNYTEILQSPTTTEADKVKANKMFKEQVDAISSKVIEITTKKSQSGLDAMMIELNFLKDRANVS